VLDAAWWSVASTRSTTAGNRAICAATARCRITCFGSVRGTSPTSPGLRNVRDADPVPENADQGQR